MEFPSHATLCAEDEDTAALGAARPADLDPGIVVVLSTQAVGYGEHNVYTSTGVV